MGPGAVYLAAVLAAHAQKGLPAFGIYGHDVQDLDDNTIPADVAEKISLTLETSTLGTQTQVFDPLCLAPTYLATTLPDLLVST